MALLPVLFDVAFRRLLLPVSAGRRNTDSAILHERWFFQCAPAETGFFRAFYGPFEPLVRVFVPSPPLFWAVWLYPTMAV
jgi:hypothetical protein